MVVGELHIENSLCSCWLCSLLNMQNFKEWAEEFDAYSSQSNEILDTLQLFIQMTAKGKTNSQADNLSVQVYIRPHKSISCFRSWK